jgi:hypothetical protein
MFVIFDVPRDRDWGENATLFWEEPESDGSAPIRQYEMSWDRGVTWMRAGGSKSRHVRVGGLERGGAYPIMLRAYNKVLPPPLRTDWTRRVPHPVLIGHAASPPSPLPTGPRRSRHTAPSVGNRG